MKKIISISLVAAAGLAMSSIALSGRGIPGSFPANDEALAYIGKQEVDATLTHAVLMRNRNSYSPALLPQLLHQAVKIGSVFAYHCWLRDKLLHLGIFPICIAVVDI
ncbi:MAG: hypothetical protein OEV12_08010 [Gammaproteobacteria bacterium]|jgi:hypothetical protein|nr:hypothetical protein [Gammaproteobacteria bacterium]MDH3972009.1 hypothetical protein [Gammaproteobacteria bacterium]MDH3986338.1 hypothetical protein [Gammaproteobacteria bacterium]